MLVNREHITSIIPHRHPMVMIDNLLEQNENFSFTDFKIESDNIFIHEDEFLESGIIENLAQTAAAGRAYFCQKNKLVSPRVLIAEVNGLVIDKYPSVGDIIQTRTEIIKQAMNIIMITGEIHLGNELIAKCRIKSIIN